MHPTTIRNDFLRLRVQGLSLASIGRQLHVSKPTLIKWNRQHQSEIDLQKVADRQRVNQEVTTSADQELADLTRRLTAVKQELFSRAMREIPTAALETIAGQFRQRIESLQSATCARGPIIQDSPTPSLQSAVPNVETSSSVESGPVAPELQAEVETCRVETQ